MSSLFAGMSFGRWLASLLVAAVALHAVSEASVVLADPWNFSPGSVIQPNMVLQPVANSGP
jgi:hypothetical protein